MEEQEQPTAKNVKKEQVKTPALVQKLADSLQQLSEFGGFEFLETTVKGSHSMNPGKKSLKNLFLTKEDSLQDRNKLKKRLKLWIDLLESHNNISDMINEVEQKTEIAEKLFLQNLIMVIDMTKELEAAYRSISLFYKNAATERIKNVSIVNAAMDQLNDDNDQFFVAIADEIRDKYDRLDLRENYSLLVLPGYLGSNRVVYKWARLASENKVMLITDYRNLEEPEDVLQLWQRDKIPSDDYYMANV